MANQEDINALQQNRNLDFVDRVLRPEKSAVINNPDGSYSSHLMSSSDKIAYPNIVRKPGSDALTKLSPKDAYDYAVQNKQAISFPTPQAADQFASGGYKTAAQAMRSKTSASAPGTFSLAPAINVGQPIATEPLKVKGNP